VTRQLSMSRNAIAKRQWREKQAQLKATGTVGQTGAADTANGDAADVAAPSAVESPLTISVAVPTQSPKPSTLRERLFGKKAAAPATAIKKTPAKANSKKQVNLISSTLPTILAGLIAVYVQDLLPEEYKPCAPSKNEASAVLGPLFEIIGRRVEVVSKASEDAIDIANSFIAAMAYGARAYVMYVQIKKGNEKRHEGTANTGVTGARQQPARLDDYRAVFSPGASDGAAGTVFGGTVSSTGYPDTAASDAGIGGAALEPDDRSDRDNEADAGDKLFKRDVAGRRQIGLLPVPV